MEGRATAGEQVAADASAAGDQAFRDRDLAGAILTIDLAVIAGNWRRLRDRVSPAECAAAIKANAYGLGMLPVSRALWDAGCRTFFVARAREGERLRGALPDAVIYVLDGLLAGESEHFAAFDLRPAIVSLEDARRWAAFGRAEGRRRPCALHLDTGINRLGLSSGEFDVLASDRGTMEDLEVTLLMSHLACADEPGNAMNEAQRTTFAAARARLPGVPASLAASSGIFLGGEYAFDLVRPGLALFGGNPTPGRPNPMDPVATLEGVVLQVREVPIGATVGYGATWKAGRPSRVALLGAGYTDGIPRAYASVEGEQRAEVLVGGRRCPVIGRISMDMMAVDVTDLAPGAVRQDMRAEIVGSSIPLEEAAAWAETSSYELLARLGGRFARSYVGTTAAP